MVILDEKISLAAVFSLGAGRLMARREGLGQRIFLDFSEVLLGDAAEPMALFSKLQPASNTTPPGLLPFSGWVGFFGYEFLAQHSGVSCKAQRDISTPDALFARPQTIIDWTPERVTVWSSLAGREDSLAQALRITHQRSQTHNAIHRLAPEALRCNFDLDTYRLVFAQAREAILDGQTYQIKISQRFAAPFKSEPGDAYARLIQTNPAPEAFSVHWDDFALISCSPEVVLERRGDLLATSPIGGTVPRSGPDSGETVLRASSKENAEHNMLIDLERNDLNRICETGSVVIRELRRLETYAHVHHLVSRIEGNLRRGTSFEEIARAMLPGGSITGCPKRRTMELIDQFEPCFRGIYTGSFGTLEDNGDHRFNLIIRTLLIHQNTAYVQAGGGIVVDSTPEYEYRENTLKAQALLDLLTA